MSKKVTITNEISTLEFAGKLSDGSTEKTIAELLAVGGTKKYAHFITLRDEEIVLYISETSTAFTTSTLANELFIKGYNAVGSSFRTINSQPKAVNWSRQKDGIMFPFAIYSTSSSASSISVRYRLFYLGVDADNKPIFDNQERQSTTSVTSDHVVPLS